MTAVAKRQCVYDAHRAQRDTRNRCERPRLATSPSQQPDPPRPGKQPALLAISQSFPPETTPTAIRSSKLLARLGDRWDITVETEAQRPHPGEGRPHPGDGVRVEVVRSWRPRRLLAGLRRLRLDKLVELIVWPDESIFWVPPAILTGRRLIKETAPDAIVVFMMPYSAGLAGIALAKLSGLPLVLNLDDSLTCTDMHPHYPTRLHYRLARALEDFYERRADALVYVSRTNLEEVKARQSESTAEKLQLVRYGADARDFRPQAARSADFEIAYVGAMSGWWALIGQGAPQGRLRRVYGAWSRLGRYERTVLDQRTSSPAIVGQAILDSIAEHPVLAGRVSLTVYGNPYPAAVAARALASAGVESVVKVLGPFPHEEVADIVCRADLLFLTLPARVDGSRGGRISAKTYEYLMTDRPILAALPQGENWDYLEDKPGVWLVDPDDRERMKEIIAELAAAKFDGRVLTFDRGRLREQISYDTRAAEFANVIAAAIERRHARRS